MIHTYIHISRIVLNFIENIPSLKLEECAISLKRCRCTVQPSQHVNELKQITIDRFIVASSRCIMAYIKNLGSWVENRTNYKSWKACSLYNIVRIYGWMAHHRHPIDLNELI